MKHHLRSWGVTVLYGPDVYLLHEPGEGGHTAARFPWHLTIDAVPAARPQRAAGASGPIAGNCFTREN